MTITTNTTDRKALAKAIAEELGTTARYMGMPGCGYQVGDYVVDRDGNITGENFEALRDFLTRNGYELPDAIISLTVFVIAVILFITQPFGWDLGLVAITGATIVIALGCVDGKTELRNMMWPAIITLGAALAIADGFVQSGAGDVVIDFLVSTFGPAMTNGRVMVALFLLAGWLISMSMSNGSLVSMLASIAIPMAVEYGINPIPIAIACVMGSNLAMATPVATTTITMVQVAGYRFKDYFRVGGLVGLIGIVTAWASIVVIYGL